MPNFKKVAGVIMPGFYSEELFISGINYKAKSGDLFIVTYPKCGTTWMQHIVSLILRKGQLSEDPMDFLLGCPSLEIMGADYIEMAKPKVVKTHLPFFATPFSTDSKYIYIARNPRDCCVSFYHYIKMLPIFQKILSFEEFLQMFLDGNLPYGNYFDHLLEWYKHKNDENVYFVTYEDLKKNVRGEILKIAKFIGKEYEKSILNDSTILDNIVRYSSFEFMKETSNMNIDVFFKSDNKLLENKNFPSGAIETLQNLNKSERSKEGGTLVRKGIVGDWRNHFNEEQIRLFNTKIVEWTNDSDVMNLWNDIY